MYMLKNVIRQGSSDVQKCPLWFVLLDDRKAFTKMQQSWGFVVYVNAC